MSNLGNDQQPSSASSVHDLWPSNAPGTPADFPAELITERSDNRFQPDRMLTRISRPGLTVIRPDNPNGAAVIMAPGGGYSHIVLDKEGREIADWLGGIGITTFLLTYRLPGEGHVNGADVPLQDAQRAMRLVRHNAKHWGIDPKRIGMMGASAGGHVTASLVANFDRKVYDAVDAADEQSARPDFAILLYPVVTMTAPFAHAGSRLLMLGDAPSDEQITQYSPEQTVTAAAPEVFMALSDQDAAVPSENAVFLYGALRSLNIPAELHVFRDGEHGFGIERTTGLPVRHWPMLCAEWLQRIGIVEALTESPRVYQARTP